MLNAYEVKLFSKGVEMHSQTIQEDFSNMAISIVLGEYQNSILMNDYYNQTDTWVEIDNTEVKELS